MGFQKAFARDEFQRRVADVKQRMEAAGFDLLICQDPANMVPDMYFVNAQLKFL